MDHPVRNRPRPAIGPGGRRKKPMFDVKKVSIELGGKTLTLETGRIARQAAAAALAPYGETVALCAVAAATSVKEDTDFFPLTSYSTAYYSASDRMPGGFFQYQAGP